MSVRALQVKRKEPDEIMVDLLRNVSLSPTKRCRLGDSWVPTNYWQTASFEPPQEAQSVISPPAESVVLPPSAPLAKGTLDKGTNEQALVLYRPVNPPLFPGGPSVGSTDLPLKVDTAAFQAACKGTGNNGSINDAGSSSAFASTSSDALSWTGLFEALDLQGGRLPLPGSRRLQRNSSCSSLPRFCTSMDDTAMDEDTDSQTSNKQLALIPYAPPTFPIPSYSTPAESNSNTMMNFSEPTGDVNVGSGEEMAEDSDAMEVMDEVAPADAGTTGPGSQFGSPIPTFDSAQWDHCEMFKAPYSKIMWSH